MKMNRETAAPMGSIIGNGGEIVSKAIAASDYPTRPEISTAEYAANLVSRRFRVRVAMAREVCRIAGIGGLA